MSQAESVFQQIRESCEEVTRRARFVTIDSEGLALFADRLALAEWPDEDLDPAHHFRGDPKTTLGFIIALDAINFGSGWFPFLVKRGRFSGYRTVAAAVKEYVERTGPLSGEALRGASAASMTSMIGQKDAAPEAAELLSLFARAWRDLGVWLGDRFDDQFEQVLLEANGSAAGLVALLAEMPLYQDVARYAELDVPLYKRAQITVADLHRTFGQDSFGYFEDLDELTLFADNLVPHVLRYEGVLRYVASLADRIDAKETLESGSDEETEIRAVAVTAVEGLVESLASKGRATTAQVLDGLLWNAGQAPEIKSRPRHRARSTFY